METEIKGMVMYGEYIYSYIFNQFEGWEENHESTESETVGKDLMTFTNPQSQNGTVCSFILVGTRAGEYLYRLIYSDLHEPNLPPQDEFDFHRKLTKLSLKGKLNMLQITDEELITHIETMHITYGEQAISLLSQKWWDHANGGQWFFGDDELNDICFGVKLTGTKLKKAILRREIPIDKLKAIIKWFASSGDIVNYKI